MKENRISIQICRPVSDVFEFTINPKNTPRWIESIEVEETNEWPPKFGTIYCNRNKASGKRSTYRVLFIVKDRVFELVSEDRNYHVLYQYVQRKGGITYMEYFEWVDVGELEEPFTQEVLEKLKAVMENA